MIKGDQGEMACVAVAFVCRISDTFSQQDKGPIGSGRKALAKNRQTVWSMAT